MTWAQLVADLEAAPEGSRELDAKIALILYPLLASYSNDRERGAGHWISAEHGPVFALHYSTDLTDAVSWVPEGAKWKVGGGGDEVFWAHAGGPRIYEGPTPAMALCIANAKAHQSMAGEP